MKGRQLPRTTTIIHHENSALKNKVKCLEESLKSAYNDIQKLMNVINENAEIKAELCVNLLFTKLKEENEKLKEENEKLKADNEKLKEEKEQIQQELTDIIS